MSNHKAHFRGDIQVDGSIVGPDGQPVGGGVDWSALVPEINFAGTPGDDTGGGLLSWDDDWYGLTFKGQPGSGDSELYLVNPDNDTSWANLWPGGLMLRKVNGSAANFLPDGGLSLYNMLWQTFINKDGFALIDNASGDQVHLKQTDGSDDAGLLYPGSPGFLGSFLLLSDETAALNKDILTSWVWTQPYPRFLTKVDGEMSWGSGSAAPDITLQRGKDLDLMDETFLRLINDDDSAGLVLGAIDGTYTQVGSILSEVSLYIQNDENGWVDIRPGNIAAHRGDTNSMVSLYGGYGSYSAVGFHNDGANTRFDNPSEGILRVDRDTPAATGVQARSPDGTLYNLIPPNGGGAATWVAA